MYQDSYDERGWVRVLRYLSRTFRLGIFFGVEVRVYWLAIVIMPLIGVFEFARVGGPVLQVAVLSLLMTGLLFLLIWTHEMGHIWAGRRFGIYTPLITLSPLGGLAHLSAPAGSARQDIVISLAGPATHLVWLAVFWPLSKIVPWDALWPEGWTWGPVDFALSFLVQANLGLMLFNLLPLFPMDGGRVLRALLSLKMNPNRATLWTTRVGKVGAVGFVVAGLLAGSVWGGILIAIGITNFLACRREALAARYQVGPYGGERRESWQSDPDAWKLSGEAAARSRKRKAPKAPKAAPPDPDLDAEVDRVLDRVREVGMAGLSRRERKVLERAAARKRAPGR